MARPAKSQLFAINSEENNLDDKIKDWCHLITAKNLVDRETFMARCGNSGVLYIHTCAVSNRGILGGT